MHRSIKKEHDTGALHSVQWQAPLQDGPCKIGYLGAALGTAVLGTAVLGIAVLGIAVLGVGVLQRGTAHSAHPLF